MKRMQIKRYLFIMILFFALTVNYAYNLLDVGNTAFSLFQADSETLVTGMIIADRQGIDTLKYGLTRYCDNAGWLFSLDDRGGVFLTDESWSEGYSKWEPKILLSNNIYTQTYAVPGNYVRFGNGEVVLITAAWGDGQYYVVQLDKDQPLDSVQYGSLHDMALLDQIGETCPPGAVLPYCSPFGLQGQVFRRLARYLDCGVEETVAVLQLFCAMSAAAVFVLIVLLIQKKYNDLMSACFYITFLLSPWIVNFARNLYWVEFTWFIPVLIGLACSIYVADRRDRVICYISAFIAITVKCLCGYEYITAIMLGMCSFLLVDFATYCFIRRDRVRAKLLFRTLFIMGCCALIGFAVAVCIHAYYRSGGDIPQGIQDIMRLDAARRMQGVGDESGGASQNILTWHVCGFYFRFSTEIITGIPGNLFPVLCIVPICIFACNYQKKIINWNDVVMYIVFMLTSISWFVLAKGHSYIHLHMNYVLWYFGYVQMCIYVIVKQALFKDSKSNALQMIKCKK